MDDTIIQIDDKYKNNVTFIYNGNNDDPKHVFPKHMSYIKSFNYKWLLHVDIDEFLMLKENSISKFINSINGPNYKPDIIQFIWILMMRMDNKYLSFDDSYKCYKTFKGQCVKSMCITQKINEMMTHSMTSMAGEKWITYPKNLFADVRTTYHAQKFYSCDNYVLHCYTRSIHNLMTKALITNFDTKKINNMQAFVAMINDKSKFNLEFKFLSDVIGKKITDPYAYARAHPLVKLNNTSAKEYDNEFCNKEIEMQAIKNACDINNINYDNYIEYINLFIEKYKKDFSGNFER